MGIVHNARGVLRLFLNGVGEGLTDITQGVVDLFEGDVARGVVLLRVELGSVLILQCEGELAILQGATFKVLNGLELNRAFGFVGYEHVHGVGDLGVVVDRHGSLVGYLPIRDPIDGLTFIRIQVSCSRNRHRDMEYMLVFGISMIPSSIPSPWRAMHPRHYPRYRS